MSKPSPNKEIRVDTQFHEKVQEPFLEELTLAIRSQLERLNLSPEQLKQATSGLTFRIANLIDGSRSIQVGENYVRPVLVFSEDTEGNKLVAAGPDFWMHTEAYPVAEKVLDRVAKEESKDQEQKTDKD